jgi:serine/threonine protein kinase
MQVLQVRHKVSGKIFAMKVLNKKSIMDRNEIKQLKTEKSILMKLSSPFLVKLYFSFQTPDKFYFVMDYINGGELFSHLQRKRKFKPDRARFYSAEIVLGLEYLHNQGIVYRFVGERVSLDCTPC